MSQVQLSFIDWNKIKLNQVLFSKKKLNKFNKIIWVKLSNIWLNLQKSWIYMN